MPNPSRLSVHTNLEFLRKEAKALLKLCRLRDSAALARIRVTLPRTTMRDAAEIKLVDVQHVLARELGFPNWGELKRHDEQLKSAPNFEKPGADGVLPEGFVPWRWSVTHTIRPEMLSPLASGREYRIVVSVGRRIQGGGYADLYAWASAIGAARVAQLRSADKDRTVHSRIFAQAWFKHDGINFARASITTSVVSLKSGELAPQGERPPTPDELAVPGGLTREKVTSTRPDAFTFEEAYSEADVRDPADPAANVFMFSYGEYVPSCEGILYGPFVERAENFARSYPLRSSDTAKIIRREWWCVTNPNLVVVQVYVQFV